MLAEAIRPLASAAGDLAAARRLAVDLVLPPTCLACRHPAGEAGGLCPDCWTRAGFIERPFCERLGTPFPFDAGAGMVSPAAIANPPAYERARAALRYGDVGRELVHLLKYGDRLDLVRPLGRWMARAGAELLADADALLPVPLHWTRLWQRRFNSRRRSPASCPRLQTYRFTTTFLCACARRRRRSGSHAPSGRATWKAHSRWRARRGVR